MSAIKTRASSHWPLSILLGGTSLFNVFLPLILVRLLAPDDVGRYKLFFLYVSTAPWLFLSAGLVSGYYYWAGRNGRDQNSQVEAFSITYTWQLVWTLGLLLFGGLFAKFATSAADWSLVEQATLILAAALGISITVYEDVQTSRGQTTKAATFGASFEVARTLTLIASAFYFRSSLAIFSSHLAITLVKWLTSFVLLYRERIRFQFKALTLQPLSREVLSYAFPSSLAAVLLLIVNYGDQFILGRLIAPAAFAAYSLGCLSIPPLLIFEQSLNKVLIPQLTTDLANGNESAAKRDYRGAVQELGLWLVPSVIGLMIFAGPLTRLLFTDRYPETETYLRLYALFYAFHIFPYDSWARATGRTSWILKTVAGFAVVSLSFITLGVHVAGPLGALVGFLTAQFALRVFSAVSLSSILKWRIPEFFPAKALTLFVGASLLIGAGTWFLSTLFANEVVGLFSGGILFWILYAALVVPRSQRLIRRERKSKRVLVLTQLLHIGGLETMILNLTRNLTERTKWEPTVFVYDEVPGVETLDQAFDPIPVVRWNKGQGVSLKLVWQLQKYTRANDIDVIHAHDMGPLLYSVLAKFVSVGRLRVIYTQHSFVHLKVAKRYKLYEKFFTRFVDQIVVVSETLKTSYADLGISPKKIEVVENGVPFAQKLPSSDERSRLRERLLPNAASSDTEKLWLICLARLHPGKGQDHLIQIWSRMSDAIKSKCVLLLVGSETSSGFLLTLRSKTEAPGDSSAADSGSSRAIIFAGATREPQAWLAASDALVSASEQEGLPLGPIEALGAGLPVFVSDIAGHRSLGSAPHFFKLENLDEAARLFEKWIEQLSTGQIASAKTDDLRERFSLAKMTDHYVRIYEKD